jgi:hypothetical protein
MVRPTKQYQNFVFLTSIKFLNLIYSNFLPLFLWEPQTISGRFFLTYKFVYRKRKIRAITQQAKALKGYK